MNSTSFLSDKLSSSIQESTTHSIESRYKAQQLKSACARNCQRLHQSQAKLAKTMQQTQQLKVDCAETRQKSRQLRSGSNRSFQKRVQLHSDSDKQNPVIEKLPPKPNEGFLTIIQSQSNLDRRMEMIQDVQSDVDSRLAALEQLQLNLDKYLDEANKLIVSPHSEVPNSETSLESAGGIDLKQSLEKARKLINQFIYGDWLESDKSANSRTLKSAAVGQKFLPI